MALLELVPLDLEAAHAEFAEAGVAPSPIEVGGFEALCPSCPGSIAVAEVDGRVEMLCSGGCDRARIADALHGRRERAVAVPGASARGLRLRGTPTELGSVGGLAEVPTPGTPGTLQRLDVGDLLTRDPEPVDWIAEGVVARGTLTLLAGREKEGKSLLSLAVATRMVSGGGDLAGIDVCAGRALVVDGENGEREIHRRLRSLGLTTEQAGQLEVFEAVAHDLRTNLDELDAILAEHKPDLLVLDSWRSLWGGDENDSGEVARVLDPLRALVRRHDTAALLIHHLSRAGAYRGSTAIGASVEAVVALERNPEDDDRRRRRLRALACRYEQEAPDRWLRIEADRAKGLLLIGPAEPFAARAGARDSAEEALIAAMPDAPATFAAWARAAGLDPKHGTARRARDHLADAGTVQAVQGLWVAPGWTAEAVGA